MQGGARKMWIALIVVLVIILAWWWDRKRRENFCGGCNTTPAPSAMAEYEGLKQMSWRPEGDVGFRPGNFVRSPYSSCASGPNPASVAESQALQHVQGLRPGSPYWTPRAGGEFGGGQKSNFCGGMSSQATEDATMLDALQALGDGDLDEMSSRAIKRNKSAYNRLQQQKSSMGSIAGQVSSNRARLDSMREGFGGPAGTGYGWTPTETDFASSPDTGGWGDAQTLTVGRCYEQCTDGCNGTHCRDYCADHCRDAAVQAASGNY